MNPKEMMRLYGAINSFKSEHPKFAAFLKNVIGGGIPEGTIIEIKVQKPGEQPIASNMMVKSSDIELFETLKELKK